LDYFVRGEKQAPLQTVFVQALRNTRRVEGLRVDGRDLGFFDLTSSVVTVALGTRLLPPALLGCTIPSASAETEAVKIASGFTS